VARSSRSYKLVVGAHVAPETSAANKPGICAGLIANMVRFSATDLLCLLASFA
jgi:hypothetical protein